MAARSPHHGSSAGSMRQAEKAFLVNQPENHYLYAKCIYIYIYVISTGFVLPSLPALALTTTLHCGSERHFGKKPVFFGQLAKCPTHAKLVLTWSRLPAARSTGSGLRARGARMNSARMPMLTGTARGPGRRLRGTGPMGLPVARKTASRSHRIPGVLGRAKGKPKGSRWAAGQGVPQGEGSPLPTTLCVILVNEATMFCRECDSFVSTMCKPALITKTVEDVLGKNNTSVLLRVCSRSRCRDLSTGLSPVR